MTTMTAESQARLKAVYEHEAELKQILTRYQASNMRIFGSVARGEATATSDIDILVDLPPIPGTSRLLRLAGINEEFRNILRFPVDIVSLPLLREPVAQTVLEDSMAL